jgi:hypothetical protein
MAGPYYHHVISFSELRQASASPRGPLVRLYLLILAGNAEPLRYPYPR